MQSNNHSLAVIEVISSSKLSEKQKTEIEKKSTEIFGITGTKFRHYEDESLIAGFVMKYGSRICDLSVKGKLDSL